MLALICGRVGEGHNVCVCGLLDAFGTCKINHFYSPWNREAPINIASQRSRRRGKHLQAVFIIHDAVSSFGATERVGAEGERDERDDWVSLGPRNLLERMGGEGIRLRRVRMRMSRRGC